ncbi:protein of unknown function [Methylorubrum extorquens]|uniref:Uncharacterized protein n=1 Tax=Methylorubrum extorquens TaxID=408 RepID=A0A2N9AHS8_METEX|nr:protein of unknown function [Methylorubrum extorquens]
MPDPLSWAGSAMRPAASTTRWQRLPPCWFWQGSRFSASAGTSRGIRAQARMPDRPEAPREPLDRRHIGSDTDGYGAAICQMGVEPPQGGGPAALTLSPMTEAGKTEVSALPDQGRQAFPQPPLSRMARIQDTGWWMRMWRSLSRRILGRVL